MGLSLRRLETLNLDIDAYLNRLIPPSPLHKLPTPISRFLGYRKEPEPDVGNVLGAFWSFVGAFCGLAVITGVFNNVESIRRHHPPAMIASYGASAILEYNAIRSPLGQPRNALLGHGLSAIIGVAITKLFQLHSDFERIKWIAGALACSIASAVMLLTGTVHPPGGATAVLAATSPEVTDMGWYFVGLILFGSVLMLGVSLLVNNVMRQFPVYWWTPGLVGRRVREDVEGGGEGRVMKVDVGEGSEASREEEKEEENPQEGQDAHYITISAKGVTVPGELALNCEEAQLLERLRERLIVRHMHTSMSLPGGSASVSSGSSADMTMVAGRGVGSEG